MIKFVFGFTILLISYSATSQNTNNLAFLKQNTVQRPKLVVGIVVDQMRWDFLYRYYDRYLDDGGFKMLLGQGWNPYDTHIPLIWFGRNIQRGKTNRQVYMTDITPTIAALLHIQMPSGSAGQPIEEASK